MLVLAVDLAAKYSAACLFDDTYQVLSQWDSWQYSTSFLARLGCQFESDTSAMPDVMVVEDLPHGLKYSTIIKTVCRLQGRIGQMMIERHQLDRMLFLAPAEWRHHYKGLERGTGPSAVVPVAAELGYTPPDLSLRAMKEKGGKATARKVATDYCSAYLIARWAIDTHKEHGTFDVVGTSRWNTNAIRKKDLE